MTGGLHFAFPSIRRSARGRLADRILQCLVRSPAAGDVRVDFKLTRNLAPCWPGDRGSAGRAASGLVAALALARQMVRACDMQERDLCAGKFIPSHIRYYMISPGWQPDSERVSLCQS